MSNKQIKYLSQSKVRKVLRECDYLVLLGERSNGKSYCAKSIAIQDAIDNGSQFIYLRRYDLDTKDSLCVSYFADLPVSNMTRGEYSCIDVYRKGIYLANIDPETNKIVRGQKIGYCHALSGAEHYKSLQFPTVKYILYEEFISFNGQYIYNESSALQQYVSTIYRNNRKGKVILIGNTISRICPYYIDWGFDKGLMKQKQGTVDHYIKENDNGENTDIAVFLTESLNYNSGMFFGHAAKNITKGGYEVTPQPHLPDDVRNYKTIYKFVLQYNNLMFLCSLLQHNTENDNITWYITPKTTPIERSTRVVSNQFSTNPYWTRFLRGLTVSEENVMRMIYNGRICYSDDLCGTEFNNVIVNFR